MGDVKARVTILSCMRDGEKHDEPTLTDLGCWSGTNDDPDLITANLRAMNEVGLSLFRAGHIPITGEAMALPLVELAGSRRPGDALFDEIMHPYGRALVARCDACLRIGGPSQGADEMVALAKAHGREVYYRIEDVPGV
jgi:hypothetical protein